MKPGSTSISTHHERFRSEVLILLTAQVCFPCLFSKKFSKNARTVCNTDNWPFVEVVENSANGAGGLGFDSRAGQIGLSVANSSPLL